MTLDSQTSYPGKRSYVLKLHRDAQAEPGKLAGRLDDMFSGQHHVFHTADELVAVLIEELRRRLEEAPPQ